MNVLGRNDLVIVQDEDDMFLVVSSTHQQSLISSVSTLSKGGDGSGWCSARVGVSR